MTFFKFLQPSVARGEIRLAIKMTVKLFRFILKQYCWHWLVEIPFLDEPHV